MTTANQIDLNKEFNFTIRDFDRIRALIYQRAGIALADSKQEMVYSRLARRLRTLGMTSFQTYLDALERDNDEQEWEEFTNALTTNLTSFFREEHHFPVLADFVLELYARHHQPINIWCSAASTGEEPYSIAMTVCEAFGTLTPPVNIIATDIDTKVLNVGAAGIYTLDRLNKLSPAKAKEFFLRGKGAQEGQVKVRRELIDLITFKQLNLLSPSWPVEGQFDVIFCRNVMIYFDKPTQAKILDRFATLMKPGGLLFAGHSENFTFVSNSFRLRGKTVYALDPSGAAQRTPPSPRI